MPVIEVASPDSLTSRARLHYEDLSLAQARTVLFLHDWPFNRQQWAYPVARFGRGYRTIAVDLPGFGRSDLPGGLVTYDRLARDIGALAMVLGLSNVVVVGAGLGAAVAVSLARCFPRLVGGLVLVGAITPRWSRGDGFSQGIRRQEIERLLERSETDWPGLAAEIASAFCYTSVSSVTRQWLINMAFEASLYAVQQALIHMRDADQRDQLAELHVPTAVFHGAHDRFAPPAIGSYLAEHINDAELVYFEHSGHAIWLDEPDRFSQELTGFIEGRVYGNVLPPPDVEESPGGGARLPFEQIATRPRRGPPRLEGATGELYE